ncbi:MAG: hypothetical protein AAGI15_04380 [Pseudomonadota bacterium]
MAAAKTFAPEDITLRAVGKKLGVAGQALYRYVDSAEHLVELVAAECWPVEPSLPDTELGWHEWYCQALNLLRESFEDIPVLSKRAAITSAVSKRQLAFTEAGLQCFADAGVPPSESILFHRLLVNATFDHVLRKAFYAGTRGDAVLQDFWNAIDRSAVRHPQLEALLRTHQRISAPEAFDLMIRTLLSGIAAQASLEVPGQSAAAAE